MIDKYLIDYPKETQIKLTDFEKQICDKYKKDNFLLPKDQIFEMIIFLKFVTDFLEDNNIKYSVYGGTLLGVIRNKGIIPWDDDIDLVIFEEDEIKLKNLSEKANKNGLIIVYHPKDYSFDNNTFENFKIYPNYKSKYTLYCDIFPIKLIKDNYCFKDIHFRKHTKQYIRKDQFMPLKKIKIYDFIDICVPNNYYEYLKRTFPKYFDVAIIYNHSSEKKFIYRDKNIITFYYTYYVDQIIEEYDKIKNKYIK